MSIELRSFTDDLSDDFPPNLSRPPSRWEKLKMRIDRFATAIFTSRSRESRLPGEEERSHRAAISLPIESAAARQRAWEAQFLLDIHTFLLTLGIDQTHLGMDDLVSNFERFLRSNPASISNCLNQLHLKLLEACSHQLLTRHDELGLTAMNLILLQSIALTAAIQLASHEDSRRLIELYIRRIPSADIKLNFMETAIRATRDITHLDDLLACFSPEEHTQLTSSIDAQRRSFVS